MSGNVLLFVGIGSMILILVLDRFFDIDAITFVTVIVISVAMVIFSLLINPSNSDSTIEKKYEKSRHTRLDFFIPIPQIKSKINIICDIENKKFNRYNSLCCLKNINSFIF